MNDLSFRDMSTTDAKESANATNNFSRLLDSSTISAIEPNNDDTSKMNPESAPMESETRHLEYQIKLL